MLVILILSSLLLIFIPLGLKNFFLEESYKTLERAQNGPNFSDSNMMPVNRKEVNHIQIMIQDGTIILPHNVRQVDSSFLNEALNYTNEQEEALARYVYQSDHTTIYYVVKKYQNSAIISYVYVTYVNHYIQSLYHQLLIIIIIIVILSLVIAAIIANSITNPLITISKKIKSISKNNWDDEISVTRKDEIGDIQNALEEMRYHLKSQDRHQREMFQNISHDLKTPIMIIEGYSQSIIDGFVQEDEIPEYIHSIMDEAKRLEKKVKSLLLINKIEQLSLQNREFEHLDAENLIQTVLHPFMKQFNQLRFTTTINSINPLVGTFDEWRIALENILDNMTRFAKQEINIIYQKDRIVIFNDGELIEDETMKKLFEPYGVGTKSNFGLGLAITYKILAMFDYDIQAKNVLNGVEFIINKK